MDNDRIEGMAKKAGGTVESAFGSATGNVSHELRGNASKVIGTAQNAFGKAKETAEDTAESVQEYIESQPLKSAVIALGVGFLIGKLF